MIVESVPSLKKTPYILLAVSLTLFGCASTKQPTQTSQPITLVKQTPYELPPPTNHALNISEKLPTSAFLSDLITSDLEIIQVEARRLSLNHWSSIDKRAQATRHRVVQTLHDAGVPEELAFVPVAESGYNPYALSPVGALGLWQLMPLTAIELGALHRHGLDGRRHVEQSTLAAAKYFIKLHQRFNSWPLALAAYNLGPWGVQRRLNKSPWQPSMGLNAMPFPAETRHYVKQILGMILLHQQGEITFSKPIQTMDFQVDPPIDLTQLESIAGLDKNQLFRLNPELDYQHYLKRPVTLHLPQQAIDNIATALNKDPDIFKPKFISVKISQGDSLWKIARQYHTSIAYLRKLNPQLKNTLSIGKRITVPASQTLATAASAKANPLLANGRRIRYKVRSGDSLWTIAKRFGTSTRNIARINQISINKLLRPGDRLWIVARFRPS
ncbi:MAG: LysM peptidoglycan-binding domain-containing protein [Ghiorsea sp.]|nr:LysM peptidoglycan-binding domain-containing protein [Ghiorsea sp.]